MSGYLKCLKTPEGPSNVSLVSPPVCAIRGTVNGVPYQPSCLCYQRDCQGCPLSALLVVLSVEIMTLRIRNNKNIKGFQVNIDEINHSIKMSQLADDTTLSFNSKTEISLVLNEIEIFGSFSGLLMNKDKTEGLWIEKLKHCKDKVCVCVVVVGIKWTDKPVKTLGINFGLEECEKLNWESKI